MSNATDCEKTCTDQGLNGDEVDKHNFPLHKFSKLLKKLAEDIYDGRGFVVIRGLDPDAYSLEDFTVVYLGITSYVAERRGKQDQRGSILSVSSLPRPQHHDKPVVLSYSCVPNTHDCQCMSCDDSRMPTGIKPRTTTTRTRYELPPYLLTYRQVDY